LFIWLSLPGLTKTIGAVWLVAGIVQLAVLTAVFGVHRRSSISRSKEN
jgi:hypothetical protein